MITKIQLRRLRNAEFIQFMTDVLGFTAPGTTGTVPALRTALSTVLEKISNIFVTDQASDLTDDIALLDTQRDDAIRGLSLLAQAYTFHPDAAKKAAGEALVNNIEVYGGMLRITTQSYNAQSAAVDNLLADWNDDVTLSAAATTIGAADWMAALTTANADFKNQYVARTTEIAAAASPDNIRTLRIDAMNAWYKLRDKIDGYYEVTDAAAPWATIVPQINALVDQYNALLAARQGTNDDNNSGGGGGVNGGSND